MEGYGSFHRAALAVSASLLVSSVMTGCFATNRAILRSPIEITTLRWERR
jgi:hypothetical protein